MATDGWFENDGLRLHYVEWAGSPREPALLLLHGLSSNAQYWQRLAGYLPDRRIVALDQRSHGLSDRPPAGAGAYEFARLVDDAAASVTELGLGRPVVAGHSWGALVALELAASRPDLVSGLAFIDGPASPISERLSWDEAAVLMQPPLPRFARREDAADNVRPWIKDAWGADLQAYAEASVMEDGEGWILTLTAPVRLEILREMYAGQPQVSWAALAVPCLAAIAAAEPPMRVWKEQGVRLIQELTPDADIRWYESAHDIPLIRPAELASAIEALCLRAAWHALAGQVAELDGDWDAPVAGSEWRARDLLAHLASSVSSLPRVVAEPVPAGAGLASHEPFDSGRWNASQLRRRSERSVGELMVELSEGTESLERAIVAADLSAAAAMGPYAGQSLGEVMESMLDHQREHMAELRAALG